MRPPPLRLLPVLLLGARVAAAAASDAACAAGGSCSAETVPVVRAIRKNAVHVAWDSADSAPPAELPAGWLRERCLDPKTVQSATRQPLRPYHEVPAEGLRVRAGEVEDGGRTLRVTFDDGHVSTYQTSKLKAEWEGTLGFIQPSLYTNLPPMIWDATLTRVPEFIHGELQDTDARLSMVTQLLTVGTVVVRGLPTEEGEVARFANNVSVLRPTDWGNYFNVRYTPDTQGGTAKADLAYTDQPIGFHTDNPYRDTPPDFQLLHALEHCTCPEATPPPCPACEVMNYAVDGYHVAELLRQEDPEGFWLLTSVAVRFENNGGDDLSALIHHAPIIQLVSSSIQSSVPRTKPKIRAINFSFKSGGYAPPLPPSVAEKFYRARRRFSELMQQPENMISFQLAPGDVWVFDNQRVLHARGDIGPKDGGRWLQGCYMDRAMLWHNFETWRRERALAMTPASLLGEPGPAQQHTSWLRLAPGGEFKSLADGTKPEYEEIGRAYSERVDKPMVLVGRVIGMLEAQRGDRLGQPLDPYEHGLQTATRAYRGGESEEVVVVSLLHDITETVSYKNHGGVMAALLEPWISPQSRWLLEVHEVFEGKYYYHHVGGNPDARERWVDHKFYNATARWCELYDQASFDAAYPSLPLRFFRPMVERLFQKEPYWWDKAHPKKMAVTGNARQESSLRSD